MTQPSSSEPARAARRNPPQTRSRERSARWGTEAPQRISGPAELLQAIPYLLGFHPSASLALVGLADGVLVVTARLDLVDAEIPAVLADTIRALYEGGTREIIAAVFDDDADTGTGRGWDRPWGALALAVTAAAEREGCRVADSLLVSGGRWCSYSCHDPQCCPAEGAVATGAPSAFAAAATFAGVVALPDRAALADVLAPRAEPERHRLGELIDVLEREAVAAVLAGQRSSHQRSIKRALFAAAREAVAPRWSGPPDAQVARFVVALRETSIRDALWMAVDDGRIDGRGLWRDLAARVPAPYDAAPLFLFGWTTWRCGDGALAGIAADQAVASDPDYSAADLLLAALSRGVDPRRFPKLRLPRTA